MGSASKDVIVRDFEADLNQDRIERIRGWAEDLEARFPGSRIELTTREQYRNMRPLLDDLREIMVAVEEDGELDEIQLTDDLDRWFSDEPGTRRAVNEAISHWSRFPDTVDPQPPVLDVHVGCPRGESLGSLDRIKRVVKLKVFDHRLLLLVDDYEIGISFADVNT